MSKEKMDNLLMKNQTFKEKYKIVLVQLKLNEEIAAQMRRFIGTLLAFVATLLATVSDYLIYRAGIQIDNGFIGVILIGCLILEISTLVILWRYRPTAVFRQMVMEYNYGATISAMRHSSNRTEVPF